MALTNYSDLQTAIASWHHRSVSEITDFITLAEKRINSDLITRLAEVEVPLTATVGSRYITLPAGYLSNLALWLTYYNDRIPLTFMAADSMQAYDDNSQPRFYTIEVGSIAFESPCDVAYTFTFRHKKGYDIASTLTNSVLTNFPAVYLYGSMREASIFAQDDKNIEKYEALYQQAITEAQRLETANKTLAMLRQDFSVSGSYNNNIFSGGGY